MKSPFKFLDAYTSADQDIFFGREKEIDTLYNMVYKTSLMMVYGLSGTGKTSLVQCGLAKRFEGPDWLPFLIRKEEDINLSVRKVLHSALDSSEQSEDIVENVERLFYKYFRPVYLLFDQFEELFIMGRVEEQQQFMQDMQRLQSSDLPCKVILILREEYIGQLYGFEKIIPTLFDYKLRVEPMTNKYVKEVMEQSFAAFNIKMEPPKEERYDQIIEKLSSGKTNIPLPYLQVYLDMLYREDYERTYPGGSSEKLPSLEFTKTEINEFGAIDDVLERFLGEQTNNIQQLLYKVNDQTPKGFVKAVLDAFVTDEGTKRPVHYHRDDSDQIIIEKSVKEQLSSLPTPLLSICLQSLENARLLRFRDDSMELAHDTLAALIDQQRTDEHRALNEMRKEVKSSYNIHQQTGDFLSLGQLEMYRPYMKALKLSDSQKALFQKSEAFHLAEGRRKEKELAEERQLRNQAEKNGRSAKNRLWVAYGVAIIALLSLLVAADSYLQAIAAKEKTIISQNEAIENLDIAEKALSSVNEARKSELLADEARVQALIASKKAQVEAEERKKEALKNLKLALKNEKTANEKTIQLQLANLQAEEKRMLAEREANLVEAQKAILKNRNKENIRNYTRTIEQLKNQQMQLLDSIYLLNRFISNIDSTAVKNN